MAELKRCPFCGGYLPTYFVSNNKDLVIRVRHILEEFRTEAEAVTACDRRMTSERS